MSCLTKIHNCRWVIMFVEYTFLLALKNYKKSYFYRNLLQRKVLFNYLFLICRRELPKSNLENDLGMELPKLEHNQLLPSQFGLLQGMV